MSCANRLRVGTIFIGSTSRTASIDWILCKWITIIATTPEAVIVGLIADQIAPTISVHKTDIRDAEAVIALLSILAVCILQTLASVVRHVTDGGGVGTVIVAVTTFTASICVAGAVTWATVEAVIMVDIAGCVKPGTVRMILANVNNTKAVLALIPGIAVRVHLTLAGMVSQVTNGGGVLAVEGVTGASWMTFVVPICVTPLALLRTVGSRDIAHLIVVVTVRVDLTLLIAGLRIDAVKAGGAIPVGAFSLTVGVMTAFWLGIHLITNNIGAVNFAWPVAHWTIRVLEAHIE